MANIKELDNRLEEDLKGIGSITYPKDGAICTIKISDSNYDEIKSVRVYSSPAYGGCYRVAYGVYGVMPYSEEMRISSFHADTPKKAYDFIVGRAKEVNQFFKRD
jgi:hypothetical protein